MRINQMQVGLSLVGPLVSSACKFKRGAWVVKVFFDYEHNQILLFDKTTSTATYGLDFEHTIFDVSLKFFKDMLYVGEL